jgi:hypothetical protein
VLVAEDDIGVSGGWLLGFDEISCDSTALAVGLHADHDDQCFAPVFALSNVV